MENEKRLIDATEARKHSTHDIITHFLDRCPTVDAVVVEDEDLLKAIKMLIKQYGHSKQSAYVHSPVAHALYHTWKRVNSDEEQQRSRCLFPNIIRKRGW